MFADQAMPLISWPSPHLSEDSEAAVLMFCVFMLFLQLSVA